MWTAGHTGAGTMAKEGRCRRLSVLTARADQLDARPVAYERGVELHFTEPSKPRRMAFVESFNGRLRLSV